MQTGGERTPGRAGTIGCLLRAFCLVLPLFCAGTALAEIRVIEADGSHVMGKHDNKIDARRIALLQAKEKALEKAGNYAGSLAEVRGHQLTKDEIQAYTAGIAQTSVLTEETRGTAQGPEMHVTVSLTMDTDRLLEAISRYRDHEDLRNQMATAIRESKALKKKRIALLKQLAREQNQAKAMETRKTLNLVLAKEETNEETEKIWSAMAYKLTDGAETSPEISEPDRENAVQTLHRVIAANPRNPRARFLLAGLYQRQGNYQAAEKQIRACIRYNPSNPTPHLKLGVLLKETGKNQEALKEFHFVERLHPHNPVMLFNTGMLFKEMKRCGMSFNYLDRFLKSAEVNRFPIKKTAALQAIQECGGARGGFKRRAQSGPRESADGR